MEESTTPTWGRLVEEAKQALEEPPMESASVRIQWPRPIPAWGRLVEQAWRALEEVQQSGHFRATRSDLDDVPGELSDGAEPAGDEPDKEPPELSIGSLMATEAILDLHDRAPEWARDIKCTQALYQALSETDPVKLLQEKHVELTGHDELLSAHAPQVEQEVGIEPLQLMLPTATSTLLACHFRAQLVPEYAHSYEPEFPLASIDQLVATMILQSRVLTDNHLLTDMHVHPYAMYQLRRTLWLSTLVPYSDVERAEKLNMAVHRELGRIGEKTRYLTERLLARSRMGSVRDGENVALVFCAAALALTPPDPPYVIEALSAASATQLERGDWSEGRLIGHHRDPDTNEQLVVSSYEVAVAFAEAIMWLGLVPGATTRLKANAPKTLQRAIDYLRESRVEFTLDEGQSRVVGWSSSPVYGHIQTDTKATSAALRLTVAMRAVSEMEQSRPTLEQFEEVWDPSDHTPGYLRWDTYKKENEPDKKNPILPYLDENFVQRVHNRDQEDKRPWARIEAMSAILFGPPGTTKTTIVKSMAQGLGWPLITLSPGTFIRDGMENVERRAIEVFSNLRDLIRVVVLFDECDELFRARRGTSAEHSNGNDEARSISAFMTASMLPKLQSLRETGQIFFVIATNYFDQIDPAAKRIGRIDRVVGVGWPDQDQRTRILKRTLALDLGIDPDGLSPLLDLVVEALAEGTQLYVRGELVELAHELANSAPELMEVEPTLTQQKTQKMIKKTVAEVKAGKTASISKADRDAFRRAALARSACHGDRGELRYDLEA